MEKEQIELLNQIIVGDLSGLHDGRFGLCLNLSEVVVYNYVDMYTFVSENSKDWEHYSGKQDYPVPETGEGLWEGKQLEYRQSLAKHLLSKVNKF